MLEEFFLLFGLSLGTLEMFENSSPCTCAVQTQSVMLSLKSGSAPIMRNAPMEIEGILKADITYDGSNVLALGRLSRSFFV